ncbi:MAG: fumarate hydratase, partial [Candidatus Limnocylindrales bacterium]
MGSAGSEYHDPFPLAVDETEYRFLTGEGVSTAAFEGQEILKVEPAALTRLAREAMRECSFFLRRRHNEQVAAILVAPDASANDREVALAFLR